MAILQSDKKMYTFNVSEAIIIYNIEEFELRMKKALDRLETNIVGVKCGLVDYYQDDEKTKLLGPFNKKWILNGNKNLDLLFMKIPLV